MIETTNPSMGPNVSAEGMNAISSNKTQIARITPTIPALRAVQRVCVP
jgi:hypothetical protein